MNLLPQYHIADCARCNDKQTECRKRQKDYVCFRCCKIEDVKKQTTKANLKQKIRSLGNKQVQSGDYENASRIALIRDVDWTFSRIVRLLACDERMNITCFCCGRVVFWERSHNMHFISRSNMATRFSFKNCRAGCITCNIALHGNLEAFEANLEKEEAGLPYLLKELSREPYKHSQEELKGLLGSMRQQLRLIEKEKSK